MWMEPRLPLSQEPLLNSIPEPHFILVITSSSSGATLIANGTADKMITFTSAAATRAAGDWDYIWFDEGASNISSMQYCTVEYGGATVIIMERSISPKVRFQSRIPPSNYPTPMEFLLIQKDILNLSPTIWWSKTA